MVFYTQFTALLLSRFAERKLSNSVKNMESLKEFPISLM